MASPEAKLTIKDGALGIVQSSDNGTVALVGTCSLGTINQVYAFTDQQTLKDTLGTGQLVELAAFILAIAGGTVICVKAPSSTAGTNTAVTKTGTAGASVVTVTGTPLDSYQVIVKMVTGSAANTSGTALLVYSLDNGRTWSPQYTLPASGSFAIPNTGLTAVFGVGTVGAGDQYSWTSTGPSYTTAELNTALDAVLADSRDFFCVSPVGVPADAAAFSAIFGALNTKLASAETTLFRYLAGAMQGNDDTDANLITSGAALTSTRIAVGGGFANLTSPISGSQYRRPAIWEALARAAAVRPSEDLARVASGPLLGCAALVRDEFKTPGLDAARFTTLRTHIGLPGFYVNNCRLFSSPTSDFQFLQHRRVMDMASKTVRTAQLYYLNDSVTVYGNKPEVPSEKRGRITEEAARAIETRIEGQLRSVITQPGHASDVSVRVDRTENILSTSTLRVKYSVVPLGYLKAIEGEIGYANPALQLVS